MFARTSAAELLPILFIYGIVPLPLYIWAILSFLI